MRKDGFITIFSHFDVDILGLFQENENILKI